MIKIECAICGEAIGVRLKSLRPLNEVYMADDVDIDYNICPYCLNEIIRRNKGNQDDGGAE